MELGLTCVQLFIKTVLGLGVGVTGDSHPQHSGLVSLSFVLLFSGGGLLSYSKLTVVSMNNSRFNLDFPLEPLYH